MPVHGMGNLPARLPLQLPEHRFNFAFLINGLKSDFGMLNYFNTFVIEGLPLFVKPGRQFRSFPHCTQSFEDSFTKA